MEGTSGSGGDGAPELSQPRLRRARFALAGVFAVHGAVQVRRAAQPRGLALADADALVQAEHGRQRHQRRRDRQCCVGEHQRALVS